MNKPDPGLLTQARRLFVGNVRILALSSMMTGIYVSMLNALLQPFVLKYLGFSAAILGVMVAIGARPSGLASSFIQPFAGQLADILGRKRLIMLGSVVGIGSMISFFIAATSHSLIPLSLGYFLLGFALLGNPASQAMTAEAVGMAPERVNVAFSVVFFFQALPGGIIVLFLGPLESFGYAVIFAGAALLEALNLLALFPQLQETHPESGTPTAAQAVRNLSLSGTFRIPRNLIRIFIPFAMDSFSYGIGGGIIYGMWSHSFGYTDGQIGIIYGTLAVSIVASQYFSTRLLLAVGTRKTLAFSELLTVVVLLGWLLLVSNFLLIVLLSVVFGVSVSTWVPAVSSLIMGSAPVEKRGSIGGKLAAFRGLVAFPAPILGGLIYVAYGYYVPILLSVVGECVTTVAILRLIPESKSRPSQP